MRKLLMISAALAALTTAASAADLTPEPAPVVEPAELAFNWTGLYVGIHAGADILDGDYDIPGLGSLSEDATGFIGGVQAGYNYQVNQFVFGLQTDFSYTSAKATDTILGFDADNKLDWLGTTTARVGYAFDNFLIYGKGGVAYGHSKIDVDVAGDDDKWHVGWTAGAGGEYAFTKNITGLLEYDYVDLGSKDYFDGLGRADLTTHVIKAGLNYKF